MMNAYDRNYLETARCSLGSMLNYAVYDLEYDLKIFWDTFISSPVSKMFENGDVSVLSGRSGIELALMVSGINAGYARPSFSEGKSPPLCRKKNRRCNKMKTKEELNELLMQISKNLKNNISQ